MSSVTPTEPIHGAQLHLKISPCPSPDEPERHMLILAWAPGIAHQVELRMGSPKLPWITWAMVSNVTTARIRAEQTGSYLARKGIYVYADWRANAVREWCQDNMTLPAPEGE